MIFSIVFQNQFFFFLLFIGCFPVTTSFTKILPGSIMFIYNKINLISYTFVPECTIFVLVQYQFLKN